MSLHVPLLILGAGPTGLGAAWHLEKCGCQDWLLVESSDRAGGLATSFLDRHGFTWDIGGHVQFSHYEYFDAAMDEFLGRDGWLHHQRESWVWMRGRFIPYPFQYHVHHLPEAECERCVAGLLTLAQTDGTAPANFHEWIEAHFGEGIAAAFMLPYNFKVWAFPPAELGTSWMGERVAVTDVNRVLENIRLKRDQPGWGPNNTFRFPLRGGTGAIWRACAERLPAQRIRMGRAVTAIDLDKHEATLENGETICYERMLSTMPLDRLVHVTGSHEFDDEVVEGLKHSSSNIFGIGLRGEPPAHLKTKCWMYFPEDDCPFYRVTVFSNYSPHNAPAGCWSLMAEVSESVAKPVDHVTLREEVIQGLLNARLISCREDIVSFWEHRVSHGYPTPGLHRDKALANILPELERCGVSSRGRFGLWKYEVSNQDHSFMQGVEWAEHVLHDTPEMTAWDAARANSRKHPWPLLS